MGLYVSMLPPYSAAGVGSHIQQGTNGSGSHFWPLPGVVVARTFHLSESSGPEEKAGIQLDAMGC